MSVTILRSRNVHHYIFLHGIYGNGRVLFFWPPAPTHSALTTMQSQKILDGSHGTYWILIPNCSRQENSATKTSYYNFQTMWFYWETNTIGVQKKPLTWQCWTGLTGSHLSQYPQKNTPLSKMFWFPCVHFIMFVNIFLPLESERLASVWTTKKCGRSPGWNLLSISSMMSLMCLLPTATKILLAACCQSGMTSWVNQEGRKKTERNIFYRHLPSARKEW